VKVDELKRRLIEENFPTNSYDLSGLFLDGGYTLIRELGRWRIIYGERSDLSFVAEFTDEADACDYFLKKMREFFPR